MIAPYIVKFGMPILVLGLFKIDSSIPETLSGDILGVKKIYGVGLLGFHATKCLLLSSLVKSGSKGPLSPSNRMLGMLQ